MELKIKKLHPDAIMPTYGTDGAACFDLYAIQCEESTPVVKPVTFRTGLSFEIPDGYVLLVYSRSGHGFKNDTRLANAVGVVDSDFRGEVMVRLTCDGNGYGYSYINVSPGDRIAQAMLIPVPKVTLVEVDELSETVRGTGGFGSTGA